MADAYIEKGTTYEIDGKVYECLESDSLLPFQYLKEVMLG